MLTRNGSGQRGTLLKNRLCSGLSFKILINGSMENPCDAGDTNKQDQHGKDGAPDKPSPSDIRADKCLIKMSW